MTAAEILIREVSKEIDALPTGPYGEVIFAEKLFEGPPLEIFLDPEPDVRPEADDENRLWRLSEEHRLLGLYIPMHSPGRVLLIGRNLRAFFWSLVGKLHSHLPYLTPFDLKGVLQVVVTKTYQHELFHFHSDVLRQMFAAPYDRFLEEALAVAWSRLQILQQRGQWNSPIGRMNGVVFNHLLPLAYAYRSPGYRDWPLYADAVRFKPALLDYLAPANHARLQANGVDLETLVFGMLGGISGGYVEAVV
jgi:hypothetical protein